MFYEIKDKIKFLMINKYANYFCQRCYSFLQKEEKVEFLNKIFEDFRFIIFDQIGTFPFQSIMDQIGLEEEISFIRDYFAQYSGEDLLQLCLVLK